MMYDPSKNQVNIARQCNKCMNVLSIALRRVALQKVAYLHTETILK